MNNTEKGNKVLSILVAREIYLMTKALKNICYVAMIGIAVIFMVGLFIVGPTICFVDDFKMAVIGFVLFPASLFCVAWVLSKISRWIYNIYKWAENTYNEEVEA